MFVGGEFFYDESWLLDRTTLETSGIAFLNGGSACLALIADYLLDHGVNRILLPEYLCPAVVTTLVRRGLETRFYRVNDNLSIDLEDAERKAEPKGAFLYINYFGFFHSPRAQAFFQHLRQSGVTVIEDNAQAGIVAAPAGDFNFNSLRKFVPYDGGYLVTDLDVAPYLAQFPPAPAGRLDAIRAYRRQLGAYLLGGAGSHRKLSALAQTAEAVYVRDGLARGDAQEQAAIERLDWPRIRRKRRENYATLLGLIRSIPELRPIYPALPDEVMPLGLPVYLDGVPRGRVLAELARAQIGPAIHWQGIRTHRRAAEMARRMMTLPIDQRAGRREMEYLALQLVRAIEIAKEGQRR